jgi:hypothetical protein
MFFPPRARLAPGRHHSVTVGGIMLLYPGGFATILASNMPSCQRASLVPNSSSPRRTSPKSKAPRLFVFEFFQGERCGKFVFLALTENRGVERFQNAPAPGRGTDRAQRSSVLA